MLKVILTQRRSSYGAFWKAATGLYICVRNQEYVSVWRALVICEVEESEVRHIEDQFGGQ